LHLLLGDVDVEIERELQRDDRAAERAGGAVTDDAMTSGLAPG
jgi:hypothetical protein